MNRAPTRPPFMSPPLFPVPRVRAGSVMAPPPVFVCAAFPLARCRRGLIYQAQNGCGCAVADDGSQRDAAWYVIGGGDAITVAGAMNRSTSPPFRGSIRDGAMLRLHVAALPSADRLRLRRPKLRFGFSPPFHVAAARLRLRRPKLRFGFFASAPYPPDGKHGGDFFIGVSTSSFHVAASRLRLRRAKLRFAFPPSSLWGQLTRRSGAPSPRRRR